MEHTKGIRVAHVEDGDLVFCLGDKLARHPVTHEEAEANVDYINSLIEADEERQHAFEELGKSDVSDVLLNLGDMSGAHLNSIKLDADYELMVEDVLQCLNNMLAQGVSPIRGLYALVQGTAIALGCALRANMDFEIARSLVAMIMRTASTSEKMFRVIQGQSKL